MNIGINKNGNLVTNNLYEYQATSIFCDSDGIPLKDNITYTPTTGSNSCMPERKISITPNVKYCIECTVSWSGFDTSNTDGTFNIRFQGSVNNAWNYGNAMVNALNAAQNLKTLVLSSDAGSYHYKTSFYSTNTEVETLALSMRTDYSNGKGTISLFDVIIVPEKYYITDTIKTRFADVFVSCNEIIEL